MEQIIKNKKEQILILKYIIKIIITSNQKIVWIFLDKKYINMMGKSITFNMASLFGKKKKNLEW